MTVRVCPAPSCWMKRGEKLTLWVNGAVLVLDLAIVLLLYKELKVTTFDPQLAAALGSRVSLSPLPIV